MFSTGRLLAKAVSKSYAGFYALRFHDSLVNCTFWSSYIMMPGIQDKLRRYTTSQSKLDGKNRGNETGQGLQ
jgi:hypothetical protein